MKKVVKSIAFVVATLVVAPMLLVYFSLGLISNESSVFMGFSQFFSLLPGKFGNYLRRAFYFYTMQSCHFNSSIGFAVLFSQKDTEIEEGVYIGPQCNIGKSKIAKNCLLGSGVHILSGKNQHNFSDVNTPIQQQGGSYQKISIGEDSWIGNGAIVMANIGSQCVVAAGSVVVDDVAPGSIVAGNPAKLVKMRAI